MMNNRRRCRVGVIGLPRSGTTWIGKVFDSHPTVFYQHEPDYSLRLPSVPYVAHESQSEVWKPYIEKWFCSLDQQFDIRTIGKRPFFKKSYFSGINKSTKLRSSRILLGKLIAELTNRQSMIPLTSAEFSKSITVWKSVEMLGRLPCIAATTPLDRFIHVIRHPCGFVASVLRGEQQNKFTSQIPMSEDLGLIDHALRCKDGTSVGIEEINRSSKAARLAWFWRLMNLHSMSSTIAKDNCLICYYDDVATDPSHYFEKLFHFSNLTLDPQTVEFLTQEPKKKESDYFAVSKKSAPIASKWKTELSSGQIEEVLKITDPVISTLKSMGFKLET